MKGFIDYEENERSVFRLFGRYPWLIMIVAVALMYLYGLLQGVLGTGDMVDPVGLEGFSNAFFRGVLISVGLYYLTRIMAVRAVKKSQDLEERPEPGTFVPCMSHSKWHDLSFGNLMFLENRLYFEPNRLFAGDRTFDYETYSDFQFKLSKPKESMGLFIVTGEQYMLIVEDGSGNRLGRFIVPEPEKYLPQIQALVQ